MRLTGPRARNSQPTSDQLSIKRPQYRRSPSTRFTFHGRIPTDRDEGAVNVYEPEAQQSRVQYKSFGRDLPDEEASSGSDRADPRAAASFSTLHQVFSDGCDTQSSSNSPGNRETDPATSLKRFSK